MNKNRKIKYINNLSNEIKIINSSSIFFICIIFSLVYILMYCNETISDPILKIENPFINNIIIFIPLIILLPLLFICLEFIKPYKKNINLEDKLNFYFYISLLIYFFINTYIFTIFNEIFYGNAKNLPYTLIFYFATTTLHIIFLLIIFFSVKNKYKFITLLFYFCFLFLSSGFLFLSKIDYSIIIIMISIILSLIITDLIFYKNNISNMKLPSIKYLFGYIFLLIFIFFGLLQPNYNYKTELNQKINNKYTFLYYDFVSNYICTKENYKNSEISEFLIKPNKFNNNIPLLKSLYINEGNLLIFLNEKNRYLNNIIMKKEIIYKEENFEQINNIMKYIDDLENLRIKIYSYKNKLVLLHNSKKQQDGKYKMEIEVYDEKEIEKLKNDLQEKYKDKTYFNKEDFEDFINNKTYIPFTTIKCL